MRRFTAARRPPKKSMQVKHRPDQTLTYLVYMLCQYRPRQAFRRFSIQSKSDTTHQNTTDADMAPVRKRWKALPDRDYHGAPTPAPNRVIRSNYFDNFRRGCTLVADSHPVLKFRLSLLLLRYDISRHLVAVLLTKPARNEIVWRCLSCKPTFLECAISDHMKGTRICTVPMIQYLA